MRYILNMNDSKTLVLRRGTTWVGENKADTITCFLPPEFNGRDLREYFVMLHIVIKDMGGKEIISSDAAELKLEDELYKGKYVSYYDISYLYTGQEQLVELQIELFNVDGMIAFTNTVSFRVLEHDTAVKHLPEGGLTAFENYVLQVSQIRDEAKTVTNTNAAITSKNAELTKQYRDETYDLRVSTQDIRDDADRIRADVKNMRGNIETWYNETNTIANEFNTTAQAWTDNLQNDFKNYESSLQEARNEHQADINYDGQMWSESIYSLGSGYIRDLENAKVEHLAEMRTTCDLYLSEINTEYSDTITLMDDIRGEMSNSKAELNTKLSDILDAADTAQNEIKGETYNSVHTIALEKSDCITELKGIVGDISELAESLKTTVQKCTVFNLSDVTTAVITAVNNREYRCGTLDTLSLTIGDITEDYASYLVFTSGAPATVMTYSNDIKWSGDDVLNGIFTPQPSRRYDIGLWYDGTYISAVVRGVSI